MTAKNGVQEAIFQYLWKCHIQPSFLSALPNSKFCISIKQYICRQCFMNIKEMFAEFEEEIGSFIPFFFLSTIKRSISETILRIGLITLFSCHNLINFTSIFYKHHCLLIISFILITFIRVSGSY